MKQNSNNKEPPLQFTLKPKLYTSTMSVGGDRGGLKALVIGATGATGRSLVSKLVSMEAYSKVATIARRSVDLPVDTDKLTQLVL